MRERKISQAGITLIALVITIIVMLILAGVSLNATIGENGILTQAQNARFAQEDAEWNENAETIVAEAMINQDSIEYNATHYINDSFYQPSYTLRYVIVLPCIYNNLHCFCIS